MSGSSIWKGATAEVVVDSLYKSYGDEFNSKLVIENCSLTAQKGRFTVLIGPSGCGKTTLVNLIAGYERPTRGRSVLTVSRFAPPARIGSRYFRRARSFPG